MIFIKGKGIATSLSKYLDSNPFPSVIPESAWRNLNLIEKLSPVFQAVSITEGLRSDIEKWKDWIHSEHPEHSFVEDIEDINTFHKLLIIKEFRPEKIFQFILKIISETMGNEALNFPTISTHILSRTISSRNHTILLLAPGDDPISIVYQLASSQKIAHIETISIAKGQEEKAKKLIEKGLTDGRWVVLENCHLSAQMLQDLEMIIDSILELPKVHSEFRLFVTSVPTVQFPSLVLKTGFKVTVQQPKGLRFILRNSIESIVIDDELSEEARSCYMKIGFALCFVHAAINERQKFGPLGWNSPYDFNKTDLETSLLLLKSTLSLSTAFDMKSFRFIVAELIYGGRVLDDQDKSRLLPFTSLFLCQDFIACFDRPFQSSFELNSQLTVDSLLEYAATYSLNEPPGLFGLNDNAQIHSDIAESNQFLVSLSGLMKTQKIHPIKGRTPEQIELEQVVFLMENIPELNTQISLKELLELKTDHRTLEIFFVQEIERMNNLISAVQQDLFAIKLVYLGEKTMNNELELIAGDIHNNKPPAKWGSLDPGCCKSLSSWLGSLSERADYINRCIGSAPSSYWLGAFIFPRGFLSAVLQNYARATGCPVETLSYSFEILNTLDLGELEELSEDGVYVHGLYIEGGRWDPEQLLLVESLPRELIAEAPLILFEPIENHDADPEENFIPLYKTPNRPGNYLLSVEFPTDKKREYWSLQGTALLCQTKEY